MLYSVLNWYLIMIFIHLIFLIGVRFGFDLGYEKSKGILNFNFEQIFILLCLCSFWPLIWYVFLFGKSKEEKK